MGTGNGKEEVGLRPTTRWGRKAPDPFSLAYRIQDTTQPGQLRIFIIFMGVWGRSPHSFPVFWTVTI